MPASLGGYAAAIGLSAVLALAIIPSEEEASEGPQFYGMVEIVQRDDSGIVLSPVIHNRVLDEGEATMPDTMFDTGNDPLEDIRRVSSICLVATTFIFSETSSSGSLGSTNINLVDLFHNRGLGHAYIADSSVENADGTAVIGPIDFLHSATNFEDDVPIKTIAVCDRRDFTQINTVNDLSCNNAGHAFAAFDVSVARFAIGETRTVSYTFDISSLTS